MGRAGGFEPLMAGYIKQIEKRRAASTAFDVELEAGNLDKFTTDIGVDVSKSVGEALQQKLQSLSRVRLHMLESLAKK